MWNYRCLIRIDLYHKRVGVPASGMDILMLGDGPGNDSIYLATQRYQVSYFDVPGSKTFDFALKRFQFYGLLGNCIQVIDTYDQCLNRQFDVVLSFEVLDHHPDPVQSIREISKMVKPGGLALITEDFGDTAPYLPTHLLSNASLFGKTPLLFLNNSMRLSWYSHDPLFKPYKFTKVNKVSMKDWTPIIKDPLVRGRYLYRDTNQLSGFINRTAYSGGRT